ncbi:universal stress protein [Enhygromyxa salina]|uniref:Putative universal stress protein n=1 Tax=Enhygromyxa salina TaxID=215803 RepID=A0A2S9XKW7_9BACT|nr:universal stress protein [Enhygromyxa salina]PRP93524.1 putative universal stress protein [Enhygromyxa salina]
MNRVLVPYDFSQHARRACALAMQGFPFGLDAQIEMLHVVDTDLYANVLAQKQVPGNDAIDSYLADELTRIRAELAVARGRHSASRRLLEPKRLIVRGRPHSVIDAQLREPDVVGALMGGQGHGGATERLLGRTAQRVIRHADVPLLVVKNPHSLAPPTRLLAAVDWSQNSMRALLVAARLREEQDGLLSVLHVIDSPYVPYVRAFAHEREATEALDLLGDQQLERLVGFVERVLAEHGGKPDALTEAVLFGDPASTIASQAATLLAEVIVVGVHGSSNLSRYLLGSTAEKLVTAAAADILVVP